MEHLPLVSVVILSWNRKEELRNSLQHVFAMEYPKFEVIVVDNNSDDGSAQMVEQDFPAARLLCLEKNIGIAGWNEGFKVAKGAYVLVLDDDSYPEKDAAKKAGQTMKSVERCGIVAFNVVNPHERRSETQHYEPRSVYSFVGCGALLDAKLFNTVGFFEQSLFLYKHEVEFSMRVVDSGFKIVYEPEAFVYHTRSILNRSPATIETLALRKVFYDNRNCLIVLCLHFSMQKVTGRVFRMILGRILAGIRLGCLVTVLRGFFSGFLEVIRLWSRRSVLREDVQEFYRRGAVFGGFFFSEGAFSLRRPRWLKIRFSSS